MLNNGVGIVKLKPYPGDMLNTGVGIVWVEGFRGYWRPGRIRSEIYYSIEAMLCCPQAQHYALVMLSYNHTLCPENIFIL